MALVNSVALSAALLVLCGCEEEQRVDVPSPQALTREAIGYYCHMIVVDHRGPKGQIFLAGKEQPLWFTSVRDAIAFTLLPEEPKSISVVYVNDMGRASWDTPEPGTWIDARQAWYVIGSNKVGGMGAPESVPFKTREDAEGFADEHSGEVVAFEDVPPEQILAPVDEVVDFAAGEGTSAAR